MRSKADVPGELSNVSLWPDFARPRTRCPEPPPPIAATQMHHQFTLNGDTTIVFVELAPVPVNAGGVQRYTTMLESL